MPAPRPRPRPNPPKAAVAGSESGSTDEGSSLELAGAAPGRTVHESHVETASESEIDSQLDSLTRRTSLEELARAGKTRNLKTLSERNLKEWIKEALRRVISSSATTLGSEEQDRLLAQTRSELTTIMSERSHEGDTRQADAQRLREVQDERDALARRLAAADATAADRQAELARRADVAGQRRDALAARVALLEAQVRGAELRADAALEAPLVDDEVLASLRTELAAERERTLAVELERAQLQRTVSKRLVASAEVVAALLSLNRRLYGDAPDPAAHPDLAPAAAGEAENGGEAEAAFYADEAAAQQVVARLALDLERLHAELIDKVPEIPGDDGTLVSDLRRLDELEWTRVQDSLIDDLQDQLAQAQAQQAPAAVSTSSEIDPDEMAQLRGRCGELQAQVHHLSDELTAAKRTAILAREAVGRLLRENDKAQAETGTITQRITAADRRQAESERERVALRSRAEAAERQSEELRAALTAANRRADASAPNTATARQAADAAAAVQAADVTKRELVAVRAAAAGAERQADEVRAALAAANRRAEAAERAASEARGSAEAATRAAEAARSAADTQQRRLLQDHEQWRKKADQAAGAEAARAQVAEHLRVAETDKNRMAQALALAQAEARRLSSAPPRAAPVAHVVDKKASAASSDLEQALTRARAVITDADGVPHEQVAGVVTATRKGNWLAAWADRKGRLKVARTVAERWASCGRNDGIEAVTDVLGQPSVVMRGDQGVLVWHGADEHIHRAVLDRNGRQISTPERLGPSPHGATIARGAGSCEPFLIRVDDQGHPHVHDAQGDYDLIPAADFPLAAGAAAAWSWALEGSRHCAYRSADGSIHEWLQLPASSAWRHADLSAQTQAPPAAADPIGYAPADHEHVLYLGADGHVHELCFDGDRWIHHDLTLAAGAPAASGRPGGGYLGGRHTVLFRGVDGFLHLLRLRRDWRHQILTDLGPSSGDPHFISSGNTAAIIYADANGSDHLVQLNGNGEVERALELPS